MKQPLVSIIVTVYNEEKKLPQMVEAILKQSYTNFELILSDDGSTDQTWAVIQSYKEIDSRIITLHYPHRGLSAIRNSTLEILRGEYVTFADADDWVDSEWLNAFMEHIGDYDSCEQRIRFIHQNGQVSVFGRESLKVRTPEEKKNYLMDADGYLWRYLLKADIIRNFSIRFNEDLAFAEDRIFYVEYLLKAKTVICINDCHYNYNYVDATHKYKGKVFKSTPYYVKLLHEAYGTDFILREKDFEMVRGILLNNVLMNEKADPLCIQTFQRLKNSYASATKIRKISNYLLAKALNGNLLAVFAFKSYHHLWNLRTRR